MMREVGRLRAALVLLLIVSAALFATGAAVERHQRAQGTAGASETAGTTEGSSETGGETNPSEPHQTAGEVPGESSEDLFGINPEATWIVVLGVAISVLLALAAWLREQPIVLVIALGLGLLLAALDLREMVHQIDESRASLVSISLVLALLHLAVASIAIVLLRQRARV
ncbi:MAG: hypothetical protein ABR579_11050 [Actinomycetota bacterium]